MTVNLHGIIFEFSRWIRFPVSGRRGTDEQTDTMQPPVGLPRGRAL